MRLLMILALCIAGAALAAPEARLDRRFSIISPEGSAIIDNEAWSEFLGTYVTADGFVRYGRVTRIARSRLKAQIQQWAALDPGRLNRSAQMAYWINLYNALTVDLVLDAWPVTTIKSVKGGLLRRGPWRENVVKVKGVMLSLDDIEHGILRPLYRDPRIHYAVNCASRGCPVLAAEPYEGAKIDAQLNAAASRFVNGRKGIMSRDGMDVTVSSIYVWFAADFGGTDAAILDHLRTYANPRTRALLTGVTRIGGDDYDWSINDAP